MSNDNTQAKLAELLNSEAGDHLAEKLAPLLQLKRMDNIVDLLSLVSDLVDILDLGTVEKLSNSFEDTLTPVWELGTAYNMAKMEALYDDKAPNFRSTYSLLKDPNTLRGISTVLRTLQIVGSRLSQAKED
ncbi:MULTISPECIES: hypothetical protein [Providencia]|uniref:Uncharacterized protein n=1 Tax=Providencia heimbachae ATCC 35613 TaxID=1354272 RepID=A0A1B7JPA2_9GAMM|nr:MULTISPECIES: hypothetical protein [Providencia]MBP6124163.1 hypothetical protein [Providencia sp.]MDD9339266.1 hypothetical protein [Providencia heimbachae]OAT49524.1 hypothetical protein M998_3026 [Providencia heimbachae ATCC 35613]QCJ69189.1 hypothetical protein C9446_04520 [Providencia heimbachae]SQH12247.1 Uncharacterised protein [Providencia heimbachae]